MLLKILKIIKWIILYPYKKFQEYETYKKQVQYLINAIDPISIKKATGELREVQEKYLEFAIELHEICNRINIKPFMVGGTLIGAIRHGGYIPWDDDLDFGLLDSDYQKLIEYAKNNFIYIKRPMNRLWSVNKRLKFENDIIKQNPNKIIAIQSPIVLQFYKGTSLKDFSIVDFFSYYFYADNYKFAEHKQYLKNLHKKLKKIDNYEKELDFLQNEKEKNINIVEKSNNIYAGIDNLLSYAHGGPQNSQEFLHYDDIYPLKKIKFEDTELWSPNNPEIVTENQYGKNWMTLPSDAGVMTHRELINNFNNKYNCK